LTPAWTEYEQREKCETGLVVISGTQVSDRVTQTVNFCRAFNMLDAAIANAIQSVRPSVRHTRDMIYTTGCVDVWEFLWYLVWRYDTLI